MKRPPSHEKRRRGNARDASAQANRARHQPPADIDWDAAQQRLKAMLDALDRKYGKRP